MDALNRRDLNATLILIDNRMVLFGIFSPFPIKGKDEFRQAVREYFDDYEYAVFTPIDPEFRVVGTTGVAWGNFRLATKLKRAHRTTPTAVTCLRIRNQKGSGSSSACITRYSSPLCARGQACMEDHCYSSTPILITGLEVGAHDSRAVYVDCQALQSYLQRFYERIKKKRGSGKAIIATARKFLGIIYRTLKHN